MSAENAPVELTANKAAAIAELDQTAAYSDMSNEQYETTRASIDAAHSIVNAGEAPHLADIAPEAHELANTLEAKKSDPNKASKAVALLALHQSAAAGDWDQSRIDIAEKQLVDKFDKE